MRSVEDQKTLWNGALGKAWATKQVFLDAFLNPLSEKLLNSLAEDSKIGDHLLDLGCGCGSTTLKLAETAAEGVKVSGIDLSSTMIEKARVHAQEMNIQNAQFLCQDIQESSLENQQYHHAFSRLGLMFFSDPYKAFANIYSALHTQASLRFICFQKASANPLISLPLQILRSYLDIPEEKPKAAGPFAFADSAYIDDILKTSGFINIHCVSKNIQILFSTVYSPDYFVKTILETRPNLQHQMQTLTEEAQKQYIASLTQAFEAYQTENGILIPTATWEIKAFKDIDN